jgi:hypothetical protein
MMLPVPERVDADTSVVQCHLKLSLVIIEPREALFHSADPPVRFYSPSQAAGEEVGRRILTELVAQMPCHHDPGIFLHEVIHISIHASPQVPALPDSYLRRRRRKGKVLGFINIKVGNSDSRVRAPHCSVRHPVLAPHQLRCQSQGCGTRPGLGIIGSVLIAMHGTGSN